MLDYDNSKAKKNIIRIMSDKGMTQTELSNLTGIAQSRISKVLADKDSSEFTIEQIVRIANAFEITSINELLGIKNGFSQKNMTPRDICKFIVSCKDNNMFLKSVECKEKCYYPILNHNNEHEICEADKIEHYIAIFFSNWFPPTSEEDIFIYNEIGNRCNDSKKINEFLTRLKKICEMKYSGDLDEEMYNILLEKYINDVPDK